MKKKFSSMGRVAIALVLALSLSLVMAGPVAADSPADTDVGYILAQPDSGATATWSDAMATETGAMGAYSVELDQISGNTQDLHVEFTPTPETTLSDLEALSNDWGFWYFFVVDPDGNGPHLELQFTDPDSTDVVDITVMAAQGISTTLAWTEVVLSDDLISVGYWGTVDGTVVENDPSGVSLAEAITDLLLEENAGAGFADWELTRVQVEIYVGEGQVKTVYIDDVTIDGTLYELEPIFLDAEYYSVGDTVEVTVPNFAANTDSIRVNPVTGEPAETGPANSWSVSVTSDSDSLGTTVELEETGANTGVFTSSFNTTDTLPAAEDEVYVQDGDTITVTYDTTGTSVGWGTDADEITSITASVDDTDPTIDTLVPGDGDTEANAMPLISASYSGGTSGINEASVEMFVDGVDVTDEATVTATTVTYTPSEDLAEGSIDVTVNVSDNAGNEATESWSFRIASWLVEPEDGTGDLDALDTVGVEVSGAGSGLITVGRYASNPQPEAPPAFDMIEDGFFDVKVTGADTTQIVIKFADTAITAESTAYVWDDLEGAWLECSDQGYNSLDEYLWIKVRADTTPNITELGGTPFAISGELAVSDISAYYQGYSGDAEVVETTDLLKAANDWADAVVPSGFTEAISTTELLALANEWAAN